MHVNNLLKGYAWLVHTAYMYEGTILCILYTYIIRFVLESIYYYVLLYLPKILKK